VGVSVSEPELWPWLLAGGLGVFVLLSRSQPTAESDSRLGSPVEVRGPPWVTPHGYFGAARAGPPRHTHQGIDIAAPAGSRVLAIGDGVIVRTAPGLGKIVRKLRLDSQDGWAHNRRHVGAVVYADLGTPLVQPGDRVRKGDPIALVDNEGFVHFAVKEVNADSEVFFDPAEAGFAYRLSSVRPKVA
jgi:murein DD-endopeptidase MepM/ murein hydrolase activator NlpD